MENKKYEGRVVITSEEYRELVTEAVQNKADYERANSDRWRVESENRKLKEELDALNKKLKEYESQFANLQTLQQLQSTSTQGVWHG